MEEINWEYISARCCLPVSTEYNTRLTGYSTLFCIIVNMGRRGLVGEERRPHLSHLVNDDDGDCCQADSGELRGSSADQLLAQQPR